MQLRDAYPADTVTGGCFISRDYDPSEGVIDLDINLDTLPAWGRLMVGPKAVRMMMSVLGWELPTENVVEANAKLRDENRALRHDIAALRKAIGSVVDASRLAGLELYVDEPVDEYESFVKSHAEAPA